MLSSVGLGAPYRRWTKYGLRLQACWKASPYPAFPHTKGNSTRSLSRGGRSHRHSIPLAGGPGRLTASITNYIPFVPFYEESQTTCLEINGPLSRSFGLARPVSSAMPGNLSIMISDLLAPYHNSNMMHRWTVPYLSPYHYHFGRTAARVVQGDLNARAHSHHGLRRLEHFPFW